MCRTQQLPMTPWLYEHVDAKLKRIKQSLHSTGWVRLYRGAPPELIREFEATQAAIQDTERLWSSR
jgi:hypothetical protein